MNNPEPKRGAGTDGRQRSAWASITIVIGASPLFQPTNNPSWRVSDGANKLYDSILRGYLFQMLGGKVMFKAFGSFVSCSLVVLAVGCAEQGPPTVPAQGVLTLDGNPVEGAAVVAIDAKGGSDQAVAITDSQGRFSLNAFDYKTGALPGSYNVIATKTVEIDTSAGELQGEEAEHAAEGGAMQLGVENVLPRKYAQPTGALKITIPAEGTSDLKLELTTN